MNLHLVRNCFLVSCASFFLWQCASNDLSDKVDCNKSDLAITVGSKAGPSSCVVNDGIIVVEANAGAQPYDFSLNGGAFQSSATFSSLAAGTYTVTVRDKNACERTVEVTIAAFDSSLSMNVTAVANTQCLTNNGSISIAATGGQAPYQYQLGTSTFGTTNSFTALKNGVYTASVKDANGCISTQSVTVDRGNTGISYSGEINAILDTNCRLSGCHASGTGTRDWTNLSNLAANASKIKARTSAKTMPPSGPLSDSDIAKIACWVDDGAPTNN